MKYALLLLAALLNASANVLMKAGARGVPSEGGFFALVRRPALWLGLLCFGLSLVGYTLSLRRFEISFAYPVMVGVGFSIVVLSAWLWFGEALSLSKLAGIALIFAGIVLAAR